MGLKKVNQLGLSSNTNPRSIANIKSGELPADFSNSPTGTYTDSNGQSWKYISFTSSGTLTVTRSGWSEVLVVGAGNGGGGQAAWNWSRSGGAGGRIYDGLMFLEEGDISITIGTSSGSSSSIGGRSTSTGGSRAGGGGPRPPENTGTPGGNGLESFITGSPAYYGGGGGSGGAGPTSGSFRSGGSGGLGGGGNGGSGGGFGGGQPGSPGSANTGGGGGGGGYNDQGIRPNGSGGSGIVILRVQV